MRTLITAAVVVTTVLIGWQQGRAMDKNAGQPDPQNPPEHMTAVFAGGCFWCTEADFEKLPGVIEVVSGYTGGEVADPSYEQVSAGKTGHVEAVKVTYDPAEIDYEQLLAWFWRHVDPTDAGGQFVDRGAQYRSAIFYADEKQRRLAEASKERLAASGRFEEPLATEILPLERFYPAEKYHQDYYRQNSIRYNVYRWNSGRDQFLEDTWGEVEPGDVQNLPAAPDSKGEDAMNGKNTDRTGGDERRYNVPDEATLRETLTPLQYRVTQEDATEPAFDNAYWDNKQEGIYVDIVSGEPLFSSTDKFRSGTGWPSFTKPLEPQNIVEKEDRRWFTVRTEVRSRHADSHLGHVFEDGPPPTGLRYCLNSAALRFIPKEDLEEEGYGEYLELFQ